ncbi:FMN-binding protein [bacterium]|nr:FMN-binding protein [bacterium]
MKFSKAGFFAFALVPAILHAKIISREEALKLAFPDAEVRQSMIFLTKDEQDEASKLAGVPIESGLVARYDALKDQKSIGRAYLDTHIVRTKKESLLIVLSEDGKIRRIEIVAFQEPPEYLPSEKWYEQFEGKSLDPDLRLKKEIHPVTGATLTAQASTDASRRVLAIDQILQKRKK